MEKVLSISIDKSVYKGLDIIFKVGVGGYSFS